jgi:citrate synthase
MLLTARETADRLGIKLDTLYAYVSRGQLRSIEVADSRERRYDADEVERFRSGKRAARIAAEALVPVIGSAICLIENHRLYYRGADALALAETASLEDVAAILWEAEALPAPIPTLASPSQARGGEGQGGVKGQFGVIERSQIRLVELAATDLAALDLSRAGVVRTARLILSELAAVVGGSNPSPLPVHHQLAAAWRLDKSGADILRRCLVLLADHELNASTFVARCVASTGATPYAVVSGALAALSGRRHGGASAQAEALFRELGDTADPAPLLAARLARGEALPGLGQPLYPQGDPRARAIIDALASALPTTGARVASAAVAATQLTGEHPNVDFALGAASVALGLPQGTALGVFLVARAIGWLAHAMEQYESDVLIRPRARYIGIRPKGQSGAGAAG